MKQLLLIVAFILVGCSSGSDKASGVRYRLGWSSDPAVTEVPQSPPKSKITDHPETKKPESPEVDTKVVTKKPEYPKVIPNNPLAEAAIDAAIRKATEKPTGELTKADLEKVTGLDLRSNQLTVVSALVGLTQLEFLDFEYNQLTDGQLKHLAELKKLKFLYLRNNPSLTKAEIANLQKALSDCKIYSNPTK